MISTPTSHFKSVLLALLVTFLWSTSFIIIKSGLEEIPPIIFAAMRYCLAFLILLPLAFKQDNRLIIKNLSINEWKSLLLLGFLFYVLTQGLQFIGLSLIPAVTVSLILNLTPLIVAVAAIFTLNEIPSNLQRLGIVLFLSGVIIYFFPLHFSKDYLMGIVVMLFGVLANAFSAIIGRKINKEVKIKPVIITIVSMGFGAILLLLTSIILQPLPGFSVKSIFLIIWLAVVNTAFAFTLWNFTLTTLSATESSIINSTMLFQIAILAWIFLGETISIKEIIGIITASAGVLFVQIKFKKNFNKSG